MEIIEDEKGKGKRETGSIQVQQYTTPPPPPFPSSPPKHSSPGCVVACGVWRVSLFAHWLAAVPNARLPMTGPRGCFDPGSRVEKASRGLMIEGLSPLILYFPCRWKWKNPKSGGGHDFVTIHYLI